MNVSDILHNKWTIPVAMGAVGLGAGFGSGYVIGKRAQLNQIKREIQEIRDLEEYVDETLDEEVIEDEIELPQPEVEEIPDMGPPPAVIDEDVVREIPIIDEEVIEPVTVVRNVFTPVPDDQWVWEDELAHRAENAGEAYVIHHDEFMNNELDYNQETLTYYRGDDIVADQEDKPIYNYAGLMGELKFGHGSGQENAVYIRNDSIHMEWEVLLHDGSFEIEVMGLVVEEEYEEADIKHSHERRFRPD
jgi:hypothetical protein